MKSNLNKRFVICFVVLGVYIQSFAKSDIEISDIWSRDGLRYRHLQFNYHLNLPTEVDWTLGLVVQKQLEYNLEQDYQQLAVYALGRYEFNNDLHQLKIEGGLFPASLFASIFPLNTLGLKAAGFSVTELYQFFPNHDLYIQAKNYWLSDSNIKKQFSFGYQYRCHLLDWCRIGYRLENTRIALANTDYWSPQIHNSNGPFIELGQKLNTEHVLGFSIQSRQIKEDQFPGQAVSTALSLTKYQTGQQIWRAAIQEGRSQTEFNEWQGTEFHFEYSFE